MNITAIFPTFNEMQSLPYIIENYKQEGINFFVIDNYSTDGTWEYLQDNNIPSEQINTNGTFNLSLLQRAMERNIKRINPDWAIMTGGDIFIHSEFPLIEMVKDLDYKGYTLINLNELKFCYTGEERLDKDPHDVYYYYQFNGIQPRLHSMKDFLGYNGDSIRRKNNNKNSITASNICSFHYSNMKSKEQRIETLARRRLAWNSGLTRDWGTHFLKHEKQDWFWTKEEVEDIRLTPYWNIYQAEQNRR